MALHIATTQLRRLAIAQAAISVCLLIMAGVVAWITVPIQSALAAPSDDFVTTWKTDNPGTSNSTSITIPTTGAGYNYDVDWNNDGIFDEFGISGDVTHDFGVAGTYTIRIQGAFPRIYFNDSGDKQKILDVDQWGTFAWSSMQDAFRGTSNLTVSATDAPNLSSTTSTGHMFRDATNFNSNINHWDMSNVTFAVGMFRGATSFNQPLNAWNTTSFSRAEGMFEHASSFNQPLDNWDMSNVAYSIYMFAYATSFNQPLDSWDMSNVTLAYSMFHGASSFNQPLDSWDVSNVTSMHSIFAGASSFNQSLGTWDISNVTDFTNALNAGLSYESYDATLTGWASLPLQTGITLYADVLYYCTAGVARQSIIDSFSWTIIDAGIKCDNDGVDDATEQNAPNRGDANDDGTPDSQQGAVVSMPNPSADDEYVTLESSSTGDVCHTMTNATQGAATTEDPGFEYPLGLTYFTLACTNPNDATTITIYYDKLYDTSDWTVRKYNSSSSEYSNVPGATFSTFDRDGTPVTTLIYTITDGGSLDEDGVANGTIVDPVGPASAVVAEGNDNPGPLSPDTGSGNYSVLPLLASVVFSVTTLLVLTRRLSRTR